MPARSISSLDRQVGGLGALEVSPQGQARWRVVFRDESADRVDLRGRKFTPLPSSRPRTIHAPCLFTRRGDAGLPASVADHRKRLWRSPNLEACDEFAEGHIVYAERDGINLYYEHQGTGDPPIVFVHGWCCDHTFFQPQFDYFKSSHAVTALDLRGCGKSSQPESGYDLPTLADDVAWLCGKLSLRKPVVVGHSLGGGIAIELAVKYPSLPAAAVAVDPMPIRPPHSQGSLAELLEGLAGSDGEPARRAYAERLFLRTDNADRKHRIIEQMCSVPLTVAAPTLRGIVAWDGVSALRACAVQTLVLLSGVRGNDPARLRELNPAIHIGVTVGAGHFHQLMVPEQVTPMIERFMRTALGG